MRKTFSAIVISIGLVILLGACNMPRSAVSPAQQTALINTSVAETVAAGNGPAQTESNPSLPTDTPESSGDITIQPSPSNTMAADTPTPSETPIPCNQAFFVTDVNVPDGTVFGPGEVFTKTWRLRNIGSCSWTSGYDIIFAGGDAMSAPSAVQITTDTVNPGQNVTVSVQLTAPDTAGTYRGNWQLRDPENVIFGIQNSSSGYFWVEIKVVVPTDTPEPQTSTLHRSSYSKTASIGGASNDTRLGIAPNGDPLRAFIDYDLSSLAGLSSSSTIQQASFDVSDFSGNSCFEFLRPLEAGVIDYGQTVNYPDDFNQAFSATIFSVPSGAEISSPIDITSILQDFVDDEGAGHFQIRMQLEHDDAGSAYKCLMEWPDPLLTVTYLP